MKNLLKLRKQKNISQQKLADALHISQQSIYKYEKGIAVPELNTLIQLADYFETSVDYLIGHTDFPNIIEPTEEWELNKAEQELISFYRSATPKQREAILQVLKSFSIN